MADLAGSIVALIEFLFGAAVGITFGRRMPGFSWGRVGDGLIGGVGGLLFVWPSPRIPGIGRFIDVTNGLTPAAVIGAAIAGALGGLVLIALAGFLRSLIRG